MSNALKKTLHCYHLVILKTAVRVQLFQANTVDARRRTSRAPLWMRATIIFIVLDLFFVRAMFSS
jgi:hypothetical protein